MTLEELGGKLLGGGGWIVAALTAVAGLYAKVRSARIAAEPDLLEQSGAMVREAFVQLRADIKRMDEREALHLAEIRQGRDDRHRLADRLAYLESYTYRLLDYARGARRKLEEAGAHHPPPAGLTIDELMAGPTAVYQPGVSTAPRPVTDKDERP